MASVAVTGFGAGLFNVATTLKVAAWATTATDGANVMAAGGSESKLPAGVLLPRTSITVRVVVLVATAAAPVVEFMIQAVSPDPLTELLVLVQCEPAVADGNAGLSAGLQVTSTNAAAS